jgi:glutamyl/glutaminyl-tRNA synthetase
MNIDELTLRAAPFVEAAGLKVKDGERLKKAISMEQEKIKLLKDIPGLIDFMFKEEIDYEEGVKEKVLSKEGVKEILEGMRDAIRNMKDFNEQELETIIRKYCEDKGIKTSMVFHPLRVAVSGRTKGPGLFVMMGFIGREKVLERIENSLKYLGSSPFCVGKFNSI